MADLMSTYGIGSLMILVFGYCIYLICKSISDKIKSKANVQVAHQEKMNEIQEYERYKQLFSTPEHTSDEQEKDIHINGIIQGQLDEVVGNGANRACFWSYHNGGKDVLGRGCLKMSIAVESSNDGIKIMGNYQNVQRFMFPNLYKTLSSINDVYCIWDIEEIKESDLCLYNALKQNETKTALFKAIKKDDGLIVGFVSCEYSTMIRKEKRDEKISEIWSISDRISGILLFQD